MSSRAHPVTFGFPFPLTGGGEISASRTTTHFVYQGGRLATVIDPQPVVGEPIFELAFAFVSWPGDLTLDTIMPAAEALERAGRWSPRPSERRRILIEDVVIALNARMGTFLVWRPTDVPAYLEAWEYWTDRLLQD